VTNVFHVSRVSSFSAHASSSNNARPPFLSSCSQSAYTHTHTHTHTKTHNARTHTHTHGSVNLHTTIFTHARKHTCTFTPTRPTHAHTHLLSHRPRVTGGEVGQGIGLRGFRGVAGAEELARVRAVQAKFDGFQNVCGWLEETCQVSYSPTRTEMVQFGISAFAHVSRISPAPHARRRSSAQRKTKKHDRYTLRVTPHRHLRINTRTRTRARAHTHIPDISGDSSVSPSSASNSKPVSFLETARASQDFPSQFLLVWEAQRVNH